MKLVIAVLVLACSVCAIGQESLPAFVPGREYPSVTLRNGQIYRNIRVLALTTTQMRIRHSSGDISIPLGDLAEADLIRTGIPTVPGGLSRIMQPEERVRTGIDKLTPAEQKGLQSWIVEKAEDYYRAAARGGEIAVTSRKKSPVNYDLPPPQPRIKRAVRLWTAGATLPSHGHYITAKERSQQPKIRLEDDSVWEVSPAESPTMFLWQPADEIALIEGDDPNFPVAMVNLNQGRSVNVRLHSQ